MTDKIRYPRTYHLPFSAGLQNDDKMIQSLDKLQGEEVVALLKMDGENTTLYHGEDKFHARSLDSPYNWTRTMARQIHSVIQHDIPENWRLCCENVYAEHSIKYPDNYLEGYLYLLSIWEDKKCLSYDETIEWAQFFDLPTPPELWRGTFEIKELEKIAKSLDTSIEEGFVVRVTRSFNYDEFPEVVTKYVREGHVQTDVHWLKTAKPNGTPKQPSKPAFLNQNIQFKKPSF